MNNLKQTLGPVAQQIMKKLTSKFEPAHLEVLNESHMHSVPKGSETHFKVIVVSDKFKGMQLIDKHRSVQEALKEELQSGVHALSIVARTVEEWQKNNFVQQSPACLGGSKHDKKEKIASSDNN
jgi:Stress-induced morphogen (activity unknown)